MLPACICVSRAVFSEIQFCNCGGRQRISVPGLFVSSSCLAWSYGPDLLGFALWWPWWWALTATFSWPLSTVLLDTPNFSKLLRKSVETFRVSYLYIYYPWEFFASASSPSHFFLPLPLFCSRETTPLSNSLQPTQSGYLLIAHAQCELPVSSKPRAVWIKLIVRKWKCSLMFITEEMVLLNAALFYIKYLYTRENSGSHRMWMY